MSADALMVIDVDHSNGWSPRRVESDEGRQIVKAAIEKELENWRSRQGLILHVILPHLEKGWSNFSGQEMQIRREADPSKVRGTFRGALNFLKKFRSNNAGSGNSGEVRCLVCDAGEDSRIAEFIKHRCDSEPAFVKRGLNAFTNKNIPDFLRSKEVSTVFLVGCNTDACVWATAMGALGADLDVVLLADASFPIVKKEGDDRWIESVVSGFEPEYKEKVRVMREEE